jgi:hypothetical protein
MDKCTVIKCTVIAILFAGLLLNLSACALAEEWLAIPGLEAPAPTVDVCRPLESHPEIAFPRQQPVEGPREVMEAELVGMLALKDGCLRVESLYGDVSYLAIWPPEFTLGGVGENLAVLDGGGNIVGHIGREIYMGGGERKEAPWPECVRRQLPSACGGPYWIVGEGVRPNFRRDSELVRIELIHTSERSAILIHKQPLLDAWVQDQSTISGVLRLYSPQRCPRIQSESGITNALPLWPPAYALLFREGMVEILDGDGQVVAREGQQVTLHGGYIPHSWESEQYRRLYDDIPGDCTGPYWIVIPAEEAP